MSLRGECSACHGRLGGWRKERGCVREVHGLLEVVIHPVGLTFFDLPHDKGGDEADESDAEVEKAGEAHQVGERDVGALIAC